MISLWDGPRRLARECDECGDSSSDRYYGCLRTWRSSLTCLGDVRDLVSIGRGVSIDGRREASEKPEPAPSWQTAAMLGTQAR